ncbi:MAG TPA: immunoglobulin domain-containing protein [Verrucomicrobiae bacterium]|nr:immunoglobulin domain-containing protein [Verrucomicrobiae bacterium]
MRNWRAFCAGVLLFGAGLLPVRGADFEVINTEDSGFGSLRQAIADADDNPGADRIVFNIPGDGVQTIRPLTVLPPISDLEIDGYSQPGSSVNTLSNGFNGVLLIQLDGVNIRSTSTGFRLEGHAKIRGMVINRFSYGIGISSESNVVSGNFIGLDPYGRDALGNAEGIGTGNDIATIIGGIAPADRNVVGGNGGHSLQVGENFSPQTTVTSTNISILNNYFGTDASGLRPLPTNASSTTLSLRSAEGLTLGDPEPGAGNVIAIGQNGLHLYAGSHQTRILGNLIGVGADGRTSLQQINSVLGIEAGASDVRIEQNAIAFSRTGVDVNGERVAIVNNRIYGHGQAGILHAAAIPANDIDDLDTGPNGLQNFPTLSAVSDGTEADISGELQSKPDTTYLVQIFAGSGPNTNGLVEGEQILGTTNITTDGSGLAPFALRYPNPGQAMSWLTATATDPDGNTSVFFPGTVIRSPTFLQFHQQPQNVTVSNGVTVIFRAVVSGASPITLQWQRNGIDLPGENNETLTVRTARPSDTGVYQLVASNSFGTLASLPAQLTVLTPAMFVFQPLSQIVVSGQWVTVSVGMNEFTTPPIGFRWRSNGIFLTSTVGTNYNSFVGFRAGAANSSWSVVVTSLVTRGGIGSSTATISVAPDRDQDGLPDAYETLFNLDPDNPADAALDPDGDGLTTGQEYLAGTDPRSPASRLQFDQIHLEPGLAALEFEMASNKIYRIEFADELGTGPWLPLLDLPARPTNTVMTILDRHALSRRFYRLLTSSGF